MSVLKCTECNNTYLLCIQSVEQFSVIKVFCVKGGYIFTPKSHFGYISRFPFFRQLLCQSCHRTRDYLVSNSFVSLEACPCQVYTAKPKPQL